MQTVIGLRKIGFPMASQAGVDADEFVFSLFSEQFMICGMMSDTVAASERL